jgi:hypothetical protein
MGKYKYDLRILTERNATLIIFVRLQKPPIVIKNINNTYFKDSNDMSVGIL